MIPSRQELFDLYVGESKTVMDIRKIYHVSGETVQRWLRHHNIHIRTKSEAVKLLHANAESHSAIMKKRKQTCRQKYGVEDPNQLDSVKKKIKTTTKARYGDDCALNNPCVREKFKATCVEKYGVPHFSMAKAVKEKKARTALINYGTETPLQSSKIRERIRETCRQKYGGDSSRTGHISSRARQILDDPIRLRKHILDSASIPACAKSLGVTPRTIHLWINRHGLNRDELISRFQSAGETDVYNFIKSIYDGEILRNRRDVLGGLEVDIWMPGLGIAIEYHGNYWHNEAMRGRGDAVNRFETACRHGVHLIQIFEWQWQDPDVQNKLKTYIRDIALGKKRFIAKSDFIVRKIDKTERSQFFQKFHIQGDCGASIQYGAYVNEEVVAVMSFGRGRFRREKTWELLRFATASGTRLEFGASKLFSAFKKEICPKQVISYSNNALFTGGMYQNLGFERIDKHPTPNYVWTKGDIIVSRYQSQRHKLVGSPNESEYDIMTRNGFTRLFDAGSTTWVWNK